MLFSGNALSLDKQIDTSKTNLAVYTKTDQQKLKEDFLAKGSSLPNPAVGEYLRKQIETEKTELGVENWRSSRAPTLNIAQNNLLANNLQGKIENDVVGFDSIKVVKVNGLFRNTLQLAHVGLTNKDDDGSPIEGGSPIIYVDDYYFDKAENAVLKHEIDEAIQAEQFRAALAAAYTNEDHIPSVREWIVSHIDNPDEKLNGTKYEGESAVKIWRKMHENAYPLSEVYSLIKADDDTAFWGQVDMDYIVYLSQKYKEVEDKDINIASFERFFLEKDDELPSATFRYRWLKNKTARSAFGDQLVFGTSGIRDFVKFLEDIKCNSVAKAIISFMKAANSLDQNTLALAGDLRPSTPRVIRNIIMAALSWGKQILCAGNIPTPALVYYAKYRTVNGKIVPIPSVMTTASHNPVFTNKGDPIGEQNGVKPNTKHGEVLKDDELEILKQVREFLELELMKNSEDSEYDMNGMLKNPENLDKPQRNILRRALRLMGELFSKFKNAPKRQISGQEDVHKEAVKMYVDRYVEAFGKIFENKDEIALLAHMAVGRDIFREIFQGLGATLHYMHEGKEWEPGLVVDTEDLQKKVKERIVDIRNTCKAENKNVLGIFTADGDTDRPALFKTDNLVNTSDAGFIYGDKLGYLTCEYIANLEASKNKKKLAVITATVSGAVQRRLEKECGYTVLKVEIGSPYVVKAMQDWMIDNPDGVAVGFERNGGFLLGSDITLDNGNVIKALPTRDAVLPLVAAFHTAKKEGMTIGKLFADRFSGEYASEVWSGLIESTSNETDGVAPEDVRYCQAYTATMGQALMRSFSPKEFDIMEVEFLDDGKISYTRRGYDKPFSENADGEVAKRLNGIRQTLQGYFNEDIKFTGGIVRMNFLDGVRMFFGNDEIVHMRPSGNSPQWRIYSEAATLDRAMEITGYRLKIYPAMIKKYLEEKKKFANVRITPYPNDKIKSKFDEITFYGSKKQPLLRTNEHWQIWDMTFGPDSEHHLVEGIEYPNDNILSMYHNVTYKLTPETAHLALPRYKEETLTRNLSITWDRSKNTLTCKEEWGDGRKKEKVFKGGDAWLEIGRALSKNIPMGKLINRPFPVITERALNFFRSEGIMWLDLFDISTENEFTIEAPMWSDNFKFTETKAIDTRPEAEDAVRLFEGADHITSKIKEGYVYEIKYDASRFKEYNATAGLNKDNNPETLLNLYVRALRIRAESVGKKGEDAVKLIPFNGKTSRGNALIDVKRIKNGVEAGEGIVNLKEMDANLPIALIRMLNIAFAASHVVDHDNLSMYPWLSAYINDQYQAITGKKLPENADIWYLTIDKIKAIPVENLQTYYETAVRQFVEAA